MCALRIAMPPDMQLCPARGEKEQELFESRVSRGSETAQILAFDGCIICVVSASVPACCPCCVLFVPSVAG
jgi:hypothetical protein